MNKKALIELAHRYFLLDDGASEVNLIRRIQVAEGRGDCFATARAAGCEQFDCKWGRRECLRRAEELDPGTEAGRSGGE